MGATIKHRCVDGMEVSTDVDLFGERTSGASISAAWRFRSIHHTNPQNAAT
jgi:hypothetical protein